MSVVIAVRGKNGVYLGADSAATNVWSGSRSFRTDPKIFKRGKFIIGVVGSPRTNDLLRHVLELPILESLPNDSEEAEAFMVRSFIPAMRKTLREGGNLETDDGVDSIPSDVAVAFGPHLFAVYGDLQVEVPTTGVVALGSGGEVAQGAAVGLLACNADPEVAVKIAVSVACQCNAYCAGRMVTLDTAGSFKKHKGVLKWSP